MLRKYVFYGYLKGSGLYFCNHDGDFKFVFSEKKLMYFFRNCVRIVKNTINIFLNYFTHKDIQHG